MDKHIFTVIITEYNGDREYDIPIPIQAYDINQAHQITEKLAKRWYDDAKYLVTEDQYTDGNVWWEIKDIHEHYTTYAYVDSENTIPVTVSYIVK